MMNVSRLSKILSLRLLLPTGEVWITTALYCITTSKDFMKRKEQIKTFENNCSRL